MDDIKYQIFISSTFTDLEKQRDKIIKSILEIYHIPIGMEMFSADDEEQWEIIRKTIDKSDYYILILGLRYGSTTDSGISFTEKEYEYALSQKKPILSFLLKEDTPLSKDDRDDDLTKINAFRKKVCTNNKMADFWSDPNELAHKISVALMKQFNTNPQLGWQRATKSSLKVSEEIANLIDENRRLREENDFFKSKLLNRKVDLHFKINEAPNLSVGIPKIVQSDWYMDMPQKMTNDNCKDILQKYIEDDCSKLHPFKRNALKKGNELCIKVSDIQYVSQSMIDEYNSQLPKESEIKEYNQLIEYFKRIKLGLDLKFDIENIGTLKASSVIVKVVFPTEIVIVKRDIKDKEYPSFESKPKIPNLKEFVKKIIEKKELSKSPIIRNLHSSLDINEAIIKNNFHHPSSFIDKLQPLIKKNSDNAELIDEHSIQISINSLLHTQNKSFSDEYVLVPKEIGDFEAVVTIISEEMEESKTFTIPISVTYLED